MHLERVEGIEPSYDSLEDYRVSHYAILAIFIGGLIWYRTKISSVMSGGLLFHFKLQVHWFREPELNRRMHSLWDWRDTNILPEVWWSISVTIRVFRIASAESSPSGYPNFCLRQPADCLGLCIFFNRYDVYITTHWFGWIPSFRYSIQPIFRH